MSYWLLEESFKKEYEAHRMRVLCGDYELHSKHETGLFEKLKSERGSILSIEGDLATVTIEGPTSKAGPDFFDLLFGYGGVSYSEIQNAIMDADAALSANGAIVLRVNTPGGEAMGVEETANVVQDVATVREVRTVVTGLLASAGVWYTAPSTSIESETKSALIGSVGVATRLVDWSEYYNKAGVKVFDMTNDQSEDKRPDISTEKGRGVISEELNQLYEVFISAVIEGRGHATTRKKIEKLKGTVVTAENALDVGLIDNVISGSLKQNNNTPLQKMATGDEKGKKMDLTQFLSENPGAKREYEEALKLATEHGAKEAKEAQATMVASVSKIINSDKYPARFTATAMSVLAGERTLQSFDDFVALYDMQQESATSDTVKKETKDKETKSDSATNMAKVEDEDENKKLQEEADRRVAMIKGLG